MIRLKNITKWLLEEYHLNYQSFRLYFFIALCGFSISVLIIVLFLGGNLEMFKKLLISKAGLGISLTCIISFLSSQIKQNDLNETRKRFLSQFGNSDKDIEEKVNDMILNITKEKLTLKEEDNAK